MEFLKDVRYRIYFAHEDNGLYTKLRSLLETHQSTYTVSLGISGCLANYTYLGEYQIKPIPVEHRYYLKSVIPTSSISHLSIDEPLNLQKVVLPATMKNDREVTKYDEVLFELEGKRIPVMLKDGAYQVDQLQDIIHEF